jgi:hypothetical protein
LTIEEEEEEEEKQEEEVYTCPCKDSQSKLSEF